MTQYDVVCPVCKRLNKGLYLHETGGYMECDRCGTIIQITRTDDNRFTPVLTLEVCKAIVSHAG